MTPRSPLQVILLAAGYGTRLGELGRQVPKPLLELGERPLADHLLDQLCRIPQVAELVVVTNARFREPLEEWARRAGEKAPFPLRVLDDGTSRPQERLGAVGDLALARRRSRGGGAGVSSAGEGPGGGSPGEVAGAEPGPVRPGADCLVLAGDTLPGFPLKLFVEEWARRPRADLLLALEEEGDPARLGERGVVRVDEAGRVLSFQEKPEQPDSNLTALPIYLFRGSALSRVDEFLDGGNDPDAPGNLVAWLVPRIRVEGWRAPGPRRMDVGTPEGLERARRRFREATGEE